MITKIKHNVKLADVTWMKVGGIADTLFEPTSYDDVSDFFSSDIKKDIYVIGNASNLIISDEFIDAVFIRMLKYNNISLSGEYIVAESGAQNHQLSRFAMENLVAGFEFLSGIPGTVGGGVKMNAGCFGGQFSDIVAKIELFNIKTKTLKIIENWNASYRNGNIPDYELILRVWFYKKNTDTKENIKNRETEILAKKHSSQPYGITCGCTFKNPEGYAAWKLIDDAGFRGKKLNGAFVSEKHTNFFMNDGTATANDIIQLVKLVQDKVYEKFGVLLQPEIKFIPSKLFIKN